MTLTQHTPEALDPASAAARGAAHVSQVKDAGGDHIEVAAAALDWATETFGESVVLLSSMGDEALVHLAGDTVPGLTTVFIDTGYHFAETLGTAEAYAATRPLRLLTLTPHQTVEEQDAEHGPELYRTNPDLCCALRKVEPLERALAGRDAWITGMRRVDAPTRSDIDVVTLDRKRGMVKINPLALWTDEQLDQYVADAGVLLNPLRQAGYPSIGCAPCTRPVADGEDPRAGRWSGSNKTECGLHV